MPFGTTQKDNDNTPVGSVYVPGTASSNLTALEGIAVNTDGNSQKSSAARVGAKANDITDLATLLTLAGTSADANTVASLMGRLTKIRDDLDTLVTNTADLLADGDNLATIAAQTTLTPTVTQGAGVAAGTSWRTKGDFTEVAGQGTGVVNGTNTDLIPSTDVSAYKFFSLQLTGTWTGTLTFQGSNDNANFVSIPAYIAGGATTVVTSTTANNLFYGPVGFRYLRVRMTAFTSNASLVGTLELYTAVGALYPGQIGQSGTWTVQPGNTANTTPWLASDHDGTNKAQNLAATSVSNTLSNQAARLVAGADQEVSFTTTTVQAVGSTDVTNYNWVSVQITGQGGSSTVTFQCSNDNSTWVSMALQGSASTTGGAIAVSSTTVGIWSGPLLGRYFRLNVTGIASGTTAGVIEFKTLPVGLAAMATASAQNGAWTVQPGNTQNTTSWLVSDHDGTTKAQNATSTGANSNGASRLVAGAYQEIAGAGTGTVNGANTDLIPSTDVSAYKFFSLQLTGTWTGTLTFQGSNDNANFVSVLVTAPSPGAIGGVTTTAANGIFSAPVTFRYLRVRMTAFTSNTSLAGTLELYTVGPSDGAVYALQSGTWTVQPGNTANTTPWLMNVGPAADVTMFASAAQTTTQTGADQTNSSGRGVRVVLDMTTVGTGSVTLAIQAKDVASGKYVAQLTGAAVTTNSTNVYVVYPGLTAAANSIVSDVLPRTWRIVVTANNANSATYSVGYSYLS